MRGALFIVGIVGALVVAACGGSVAGAGGDGPGGAGGSTTTGTGGAGGGDCVKLCDEANQCPGATMTDCASSCPMAATLNTAAGCTSEYDATLACVGSQSDPCTTVASACSSLASAYEACIKAFCEATPTPPACEAP